MKLTIHTDYNSFLKDYYQADIEDFDNCITHWGTGDFLTHCIAHY